MTTALIKYDAACRAIAECKAIDEVKDWRDKAAALQAYARQAKNKELEVDCAEIRIRAERMLGGMLADTPKNEGGRPSDKPVVTVDRLTLSELGITKDLSSRAQSLAAIPEAEFEQVLAQHRDEQQAVTGRTMERLSKKAHVSNNGGENEWYTPAVFIAAARAVMGAIDLDPASCELANETVRAEKYFDVNSDGLKHQWSGRVWMNPPYAQPLIQQFCQKIIDEYDTKRVDQACVLVNNGTETAWGQSLLLAASAVCFPHTRIKFIDKEGSPSGAPLQGQMIAYLGKNAQKFDMAFDLIGAILHG